MPGVGFPLLGVPGVGPGSGSEPVNTVVPAIASSAVIGTTITPTAGTWTGNPVLTYQWQRYVGAAWQDIVGATTAARAPVDADWGYSLRLAEIPNGNAAMAVYSNATELVAEAPAQSQGAELLTNGDFAVWTGDNPDGWTVFGESGSDPMVTQVAPDGSAGTGAARFYSSATGASPRINQSSEALVADAYYETDVDVSAHTSGRIDYLLGTLGSVTSVFNAAGSYRTLARCQNGTNVYFRGGTAPTNLVVNRLGLRRLTPNAALVAPSVDMRITQAVTLPASPAAGTQVWIKTRISDDAAGNYWNTVLEWAGSQWNITTYSVVGFSRTVRISASNIGVATHVRLNMNADSISLYTSADGSTFTQRGSAINNSTYQAATGVNVLATGDVTLGHLDYAAAS